MKNRSALGAKLPHESAYLHVSGEARYVDDLPEPHGMLHAQILPSPWAHARILRKDATHARNVPGVHAVLFAEDLPAHNQVGPVIPDEPLLATDLVHCVGQAVAVVYAETPDQARAALAKIEVDYEPLEAVLDIDTALEKQHHHGTPHRIVRGDPDQVIKNAPHRLQGSAASGAQDHFYLETHCALAIPGENRTLEVFSSTQHPSETQILVAEHVGWGRHQVVVTSPRMGGAFGGKETQAAHWACLAAVGAVLTGRAVKAWLSRDQDMTTTGRRHPFKTSWNVGFDDEGKILGLDAHIVGDGGWAADLSLAIVDRACFHIDNTYWLPHVRIVGEVVRTNHVSNTAFRGFGGPQGMVVIERIIEQIAYALDRDPLEVRKRNFYAEDTCNQTPYGQTVEGFRIPRMLKQLEASSDLHERRNAIEKFNAQHEWIKRGIALTPVKFGISFTASFLNQAGAYIVLYADGTAQLNHGGTEMGQGLYQKMVQICAHELGLPVDAIRPMPTATDKVPNTSATAASSGADLNGQAVALAARSIVDRLKAVAADQLNTTPDQIQIRAGQAHTTPPSPDAWAWHNTQSITLPEVTQAAYMAQISMAAAGFYRTPDIGYDRDAGHGKPFHYFAYGVAASEVEVNGLTGEWKCLRADVVHDVGDSLSPDIDKGQVEGAFVQGMGWLTCEEMVWSAEGHTLTHSPSTYKIPAVGDAPTDFRVDLLQSAPQEGVIHGSKAVGEPPFMLAISVYVALERAVRAFGNHQVAVALNIPATIETIALAVDEVRQRAADKKHVEASK